MLGSLGGFRGSERIVTAIIVNFESCQLILQDVYIHNVNIQLRVQALIFPHFVSLFHISR